MIPSDLDHILALNNAHRAETSALTRDELIHWFDAADLVLDATLGDTLTREELGFPVAEPEEADDNND